VDADGAPDHLRHDEMVFQLAKHEVEQRQFPDQ
jgi:hypothetical protein